MHPYTDVHPLRGCELCSQHRRVAGVLMCADAVVAGALGLVPCELARYGQPGQPGGCGRDAHRLQLRPAPSAQGLLPLVHPLERQAA